MIDGDKLLEVGGLLKGVSETRLRELCIEALRRARKQEAKHGSFTRHGHLGRYLVPLLAESRDVQLTNPQALAEIFHQADTYEALAPIAEFLDWFVRAGFALALSGEVNHFPITYQLTRSGVQLLDAESDHPLLPGSVERLRTRCPGLPDGVIDLLGDSHACFERMLLRPAVTIMGVAYESAIELVVETLIARTILPKKVLDLGAAARIGRIRGIVDARLPGATPEERDHRFAVHQAYNFADDLRRRRNDASHTRPRFGFDDRAEIEDLIVAASRNLPPLWSLHA